MIVFVLAALNLVVIVAVARNLVAIGAAMRATAIRHWPESLELPIPGLSGPVRPGRR